MKKWKTIVLVIILIGILIIPTHRYFTRLFYDNKSYIHKVLIGKLSLQVALKKAESGIKKALGK